tara:strand:- start:20729 stop:21214 length:486 start_codon:yes stop_codon:yes gene_type:complete
VYPHSFITFITDDSMDHIYFDAHRDDSCYEIFHQGSFINFMEGRHFCIGTQESELNSTRKGNAHLLRYNKPREILKFPFRDKIFLSYCTDVFHPNVGASPSEGGLDLGGFPGRMFPKEIKDLSLKVTAGKELVGIAVAEYSPCDENYKTADIFVEILKSLI